MTITRMTLLRQSGLSFALIMALVGCAALSPASVKSNVPSERLTHETYTSPDGGYRVTLLQLKAGAKIEEHQVGPEKHGVCFSDASGTAYRIIRIDNTNAKFTLEQISDQSKVGELFRENLYLQSDRGRELRLAGLRKEGSPLISQMKLPAASCGVSCKILRSHYPPLPRLRRVPLAFIPVARYGVFGEGE